MLNNDEFIEMLNLTHQMFNDLQSEDFEQLLVNQNARDNLLVNILNDKEFLQENIIAFRDFFELNNKLSTEIGLMQEDVVAKLAVYRKGRDAKHVYGS
jgi:hypothetical protein